MSGYVSVRASAATHMVPFSYYSPGALKSQRMDIYVRVCIYVRKPAPMHRVLTAARVRKGSNSQRMDIHVRICICEKTCINTHGSYRCSYQDGFKLTEDGYSRQCMYLR